MPKSLFPHSWMHQRGQPDEVYIDSGMAIAGQIETFPRDIAGANEALITGDTFYTFFKAPVSQTVSNITLYCTIAAVAPTILRAGLCTIAAGVATLVAQTADFHTAIPAANTVFTKAFDASIASSYAMVRGTIYGLAVIQVGGSTMMSLRGVTWSAGAFGLLVPVWSGITTGHVDLITPDTIVSGATSLIWGSFS